VAEEAEAEATATPEPEQEEAAAVDPRQYLADILAQTQGTGGFGQQLMEGMTQTGTESAIEEPVVAPEPEPEPAVTIKEAGAEI
jgi:hypothetical protein